MTDLKDSIEKFRRKTSVLKDWKKLVPQNEVKSTKKESKRDSEKNMDDVLHEIVGTTKSTFEVLKKWWADVIAVYFFVYYTAKRQKTNKAKATVSFISKGLGITEARVRKAKNYLKKHNLIKDEVRKDRKWKIIWWYVSLNYMFRLSTLTNFHRVDFWDTNAYREKCKMLIEKNFRECKDITKAPLCYASFTHLQKYPSSFIHKYKSIPGNTEAQNICAIFKYKKKGESISLFTDLYLWLCQEFKLTPVVSVLEINILSFLCFAHRLRTYEDVKNLLLKFHYINPESLYHSYTISNEINEEVIPFEWLPWNVRQVLFETISQYEHMKAFLLTVREYDLEEWGWFE